MFITPRLGSSGFYSAGGHYGIKAKVIYTLQQIESFSSALSRGIDIYSKYYEPYEILKDIYESDLANGASLLTITGSGSEIVLPNARLDKYPIANVVDYSHVIVSCDLGDLPDDVLTEHIQQELVAIAASGLGVTAVAREHRIPTELPVTVAEHETLEAARLLKVDDSESLYSRHAAAMKENRELREKIALLERYIRENA